MNVRPLLAAALLAGGSAALGADAPPPVLPTSSVAAVLAQRGALELTPAQVKSLETIQSRLERQRQEAKDALAHPPEDRASSSPAQRPPQGGATPQGAPGMPGGKSRPPPNVRPAAPDPAKVLQERLDELDTQAFLQAVEELPESKRERATAIAERYREQLFDQREREQRK